MNINNKIIRAKFIQIIAMSNDFNIPKIFIFKSNLFPAEIFPKISQAKIVPNRTNIDERINKNNIRKLIELRHSKNPPL